MVGKGSPGYWQPRGRTHSTRVIKRLVSRPGALILHDMWMRPQGKDRCASIRRSGRPSPGQIEPHQRTGRERATDRGPEVRGVASAEVPRPASLGGPRWGRTVLAVQRKTE